MYPTQPRDGTSKAGGEKGEMEGDPFHAAFSACKRNTDGEGKAGGRRTSSVQVSKYVPDKKFQYGRGTKAAITASAPISALRRPTMPSHAEPASRDVTAMRGRRTRPCPICKVRSGKLCRNGTGKNKEVAY